MWISHLSVMSLSHQSLNPRGQLYYGMNMSQPIMGCDENSRTAQHTVRHTVHAGCPGVDDENVHRELGK